MKLIYTAPNRAAAEFVLEEFIKNMNLNALILIDPGGISSMVCLFDCSVRITIITYTTNLIKNLNGEVKKH